LPFHWFHRRCWWCSSTPANPLGSGVKRLETS
jgi:hypothetical protein